MFISFALLKARSPAYKSIMKSISNAFKSIRSTSCIWALWDWKLNKIASWLGNGIATPAFYASFWLLTIPLRKIYKWFSRLLTWRTCAFRSQVPINHAIPSYNQKLKLMSDWIQSNGFWSNGYTDHLVDIFKWNQIIFLLKTLFIHPTQLKC